MGYYDKTSLDLLGQRINRDNPDLKAQLTSDNIIVLGGPYTSGLGTSGRNSRVVINGKTGSGVVGKKEFFYDRLNIGMLFNGITVVFTAANNSSTVADLLPALNEQYGLGLTSADLANGATKLGRGYTPTPVTLTIASTSLVYTGSLNVIWTRKPVGYYPDSGPGGKYLLAGDMTNGYFGTVTQAQLVSIPDLFVEMFSGINTGATVVQNTNTYWLKFAIDGKIVYFPSRTIITNITWNEIVAAGYGRGDSQYPTVLKTGAGDYFFVRSRLPRVAESEITPGYRGDPTGDIMRLFNNVHTGNFQTGLWDSLADVDLTDNFWTINRTAANATTTIVTTMNQSNPAITLVPIDSKGNWRPMLIFVPGKDVTVPVRNIQGSAYTKVKAPVLTINKEPDPLMLVRPINIAGTYVRVVPKPRVNNPVSNPLQAPNKIIGLNPIKGIRFKVEIIIDKRIDLSTTNAELDGFQ